MITLTVWQLVAIILASFSVGWFVGLSPLLYIVLRAIRSEDWDDSNLFNVFRVLWHLASRPSDFAKMWYIDEQERPRFRPFWYIGHDEISEVVDTESNDERPVRLPNDRK